MSDMDKRVVQMTFDNQKFEKNVQKSVKSLNTLKESLDMENAAKKFETLENTIKGLNLDTLTNGIKQVNRRFSALGIAGMTVIQNLVNTAINAGKKVVSALTIDPVKTGMDEYTTQLNAVQTILANTKSKGTTIDDVNKALDELNHYADMTIYNFTEMTRNIGTFTAAGVNLDKATSSIKGIANLAATSGSNATQASTAMYQLSQAISSGTVRLQDWNSVQNAGMGGELFQQALRRTAAAEFTMTGAQKKAFDKLQKGEMSFRDSLSSGWLTGDVLTRTLEQFTGDLDEATLASRGYTEEQIKDILDMADTAKKAATEVKTIGQLWDTMKEAVQSGWTQSWELILGDFEEAKALFTSISDHFQKIIGLSADSRNAILQSWKDLGGRNDLIATFWNITYSIESFVSVAKDAFSKVFEPLTGSKLKGITGAIRAISWKIRLLTLDGAKMEKIKTLFSGIASVLGLVKDAASWVWRQFTGLFSTADNLEDGFLSAAEGVGTFLTEMVNTVRESSFVQAALTAIKDIIGSIKTFAGSAWSAIKNFFGKVKAKIDESGLLTTIGQGITDFLALIPKGIEKLQQFGAQVVEYIENSEEIQTVWTNIKAFFKPVIDKVTEYAGKFKDAIASWFSAGDGTDDNSTTLADKIENLKTNVVNKWNEVKAWFGELFTKTIPEFLNKTFPSIDFGAIFSSIGGFFSSGWEKIKRFASDFTEGVQAFFSVDTEGMSFGDRIKARFAAFGTAIGDGFSAAKDKVVEVWNGFKTSISNFFSKTIPDFFTKTIPSWVDILSVPVNKLLGVALSGFGIMALIGTFKLFFKSLKTVFNFAGIVKNLAKSLKSGTLTLKQVTKQVDSLGTTFLKIAASIAIVAGVAYLLGKFDEDGTVTKGLVRLGIIMGSLLTFVLLVAAVGKKIDSSGSAIDDVGKGLMKIVGSIAILAGVVAVLGYLPESEIKKGFTRAGILMAGMLAFTAIAAVINRFIGKSGSGMKNAAHGMLYLASALALLTVPIFILGKMDKEQLTQGLISVAELAVGMTAAMIILSKFANKGIKGAGAMVVMAAALTLLIVPIAALFAMNLLNSDAVWKSVGQLVIIMGALAGAMVAISNININLWSVTKFALALAIIGAGLGAAVAIFLSITSSSLVSFTEVLNEVGTNLAMFTDTTSGINGGSVQGPIEAMKALIAVAGETVGVNVAGFEAFASKITLLGARLSVFSTFAEDCDTTAVGNAKQVVDDIEYIATKMAALSTGGIDLDEISRKITKIGSAIGLYYTCSKPTDESGNPINGKISPEDLDITGIKALFNKWDELKIDESTISTISGYKEGGSNDLIDFALGLNAIGGAITSYSDAISKITPEAVTNSDNMFKVLTNLRSNLTTTTLSVFGLFTTSVTDLNTFGDQIAALGGGVSSFVGNLDGITEEKTKRVDDLFGVLTKLQENLGTEGGFLHEFIFGNKANLATFGTRLITLGDGMSKFKGGIDSLKDVKVYTDDNNTVLDNWAKVLTFLTTLQTDIATAASETDRFYSLNFTSIGTDLENFATSMETFMPIFDGITVGTNWASVSGVITDVVKFANDVNAVNMDGYKLAQLGEDLYHVNLGEKGLGPSLRGFFNCLKETDTTKIGLMVDFLKSIASALVGIGGVNDDSVDELTTFAKGLVENFALGIQNGSDSLYDKVNEINNEAVSKINARKTDWETCGKNLTLGMRDGINAMARYVNSSAVNVAAGALRTIQMTWSVHSPSKKAEELSKYFDLGLAQGFDRYAKVVDGSASDVGASAVDSAQTMLNGLNAVSMDNVDYAPTIRPVIDTSNVTRGVAAVNSMLSEDHNMTLGAAADVTLSKKIDSLQLEDGKMVSNFNNRDVVDAVIDLDGRLGELGEAITTMQLVLDSGQLVGGIGTQMDKQLGVIAGRKGRGG